MATKTNFLITATALLTLALSACGGAQPDVQGTTPADVAVDEQTVEVDPFEAGVENACAILQLSIEADLREERGLSADELEEVLSQFHGMCFFMTANEAYECTNMDTVVACYGDSTTVEDLNECYAGCEHPPTPDEWFEIAVNESMVDMELIAECLPERPRFGAFAWLDLNGERGQISIDDRALTVVTPNGECWDHHALPTLDTPTEDSADVEFGAESAAILPSRDGCGSVDLRSLLLPGAFGTATWLDGGCRAWVDYRWEEFNDEMESLVAGQLLFDVSDGSPRILFDTSVSSGAEYLEDGVEQRFWETTLKYAEWDLPSGTLVLNYTRDELRWSDMQVIEDGLMAEIFEQTTMWDWQWMLRRDGEWITLDTYSSDRSTDGTTNWTYSRNGRDIGNGDPERWVAAICSAVEERWSAEAPEDDSLDMLDGDTWTAEACEERLRSDLEDCANLSHIFGCAVHTPLSALDSCWSLCMVAE